MASAGWNRALSRNGICITGFALLFAALGGCGGGGGSSAAVGGGTIAPTYAAGTFLPSSTLAARCANPRAGKDTAGSTLIEKFWLRSWTNELYLWYSEVPDQNPANIATTADYFAVLKTPATTASGALKDKFHFTYPTDAWIALSQSGASFGYGATWVLNKSTPPRNIVVAYTEPGSPAVATGINLARGATVLSVDGADAVNGATQANVDTLNAGLFPTAAGQAHTFVIKDAGSTSQRTVTITSQNITETPVQNVKVISSGGANVGYMLFNDHIATAESALVSAINTLKAASVQDLVLDIRYNGGGYLDIASELAYMIAGPTPTSGKTFEQTQFSDKYPTKDPVTGQALTPTQFHNTGQGFSVTKGTALPTLGLSRVYVLTGPSTCSASESIINGLRGVNVDVIQIGSTTCGKPYGFYPQDNCGTTYFSIEFRGVNAKGFGDYTDGFSPMNTASNAGALLEGCSVADDFGHALGDPAEGRLAVALSYRISATCPAATGLGVVKAQSVESEVPGTEGWAPKNPWAENRIFRN